MSGVQVLQGALDTSNAQTQDYFRLGIVPKSNIKEHCVEGFSVIV